MNELCKISVLTMLLTSCLYLHTNCSEVNTETYVSKNGFAGFQLTQHSGFFFAQHIVDSVKVKKPNSVDVPRTQNLKFKNPDIAIFYAVIPGILVHGAGHFYAGEKKTGIFLLATGTVGFFIFAGGALAEGLSGMDDTGSQNNNYDGTMFIGAALFFGSWIYDLMGAPLAVQKYNQKLLEKQNISFKFSFNQKYHSADFQTYVSF